MNRRNAVKTTFGLTIGAFLFQGCQSSPSVILDNLILNNGDYETIASWVQSVLPLQSAEANFERTDFILRTVDQFFTLEDIRRFGEGVKEVQSQLNKAVASNPALNNENLIEYWKSLEQIESSTAQYMIKTIKDLSIRHYVNNEGYLTQVMDYQFVPSNYEPCKSITE